MRTTWQHSLWVVLTTTAISLLAAGLSGPIWGQSLEEQLVTSLQRYQELGAQGNYAEAIPSVKKFIELSEKQFGLGDEFTVIATNNLAEYYVLLGRYAEAEQVYQHIFEIIRIKLGENHNQFARALHGQAFSYHEQGIYKKAEPLYLRSLEIYKKVPIAGDPNIGMTLRSLGNLYKALGLYNMASYNKAESYFKQSLEALETAVGPGHPYVATALANLGELYIQMGQLDKAEPLFQRAQRIFENAETQSGVEN